MAGWFIVNVADAEAVHHPTAGTYVPFETREAKFPEFGINIHVLQPGEPNAKYHAEAAQEDFLVLAGECIAIIQDEERRLKAWDFLHCPAGTEHVFVGAGTGPCAILMVGARGGGERAVNYPQNDVAARYNASAVESTTLAQEAYADWDNNFTPTRLSWPIA